MLQEEQEQSIFEVEELQIDYATSGQRFLNFIIDLILIRSALAGIFHFMDMHFELFRSVLYFDGGGMTFNPVNITLDSLLLIVAYTVIEGVTKGYTIGKLITGTRAVQNNTTRPITWKDAFVRSVCRIIPFEPLSGLMAYPWHDRLSKTIVIKTR